MQITRYDGTRFITEEEIDREFTDCWVLVSTEDRRDALQRQGYLVASSPGADENFPPLSDIGMLEFDSKAMIIYGCKERGGDVSVNILI
ncbi:MAG: hypothetical protein FWG65_04555 [Turicibacter sp.]|nr:hypothetical protein [Turicibacter sp.]